MISKVDNNCSFKANLDIAVKVKDKARLQNIQELFKNSTKSYPNETLYLTKGENGQLAVHTTNIKNYFNPNEVYTDTLQKYMDKYNDKELSKILISAFKAIRLTDISSNIEKTIQYNKEKFRSNNIIANNLRKIGRDNFAEKYELFAKFNKDKILTLSKQLNSVKDNFIKQRAQTSKQFPDIMKLDI